MRSALMLLAGLVSISLSGHAGTLALDITPNHANDVNNGHFSLGWEFTVNNPITVTALDYYASNGVAVTQNHEVGIYDLFANLLVSTTVLTTDPVIGTGGWATHAVAPTLLAPGTYVIAGASHNNLYTYEPFVLSTIPEITYVTDRSDSSDTLIFPTSSSVPARDASNSAWYGPSFEVSGSAVPEPSTVTLVMGGLALAAFRRRRR